MLVPVIRNADKRLLKDLVQRYDELVELARQRKLPADATGGSIATVTNFGTFGLTWATPIPLPEQTLVLGMGAARRVPNWDAAKGQFVPVMEANLTLSFDHRVLDGGAAGRLLARVAQLLASPEGSSGYLDCVRSGGGQAPIEGNWPSVRAPWPPRGPLVPAQTTCVGIPGRGILPSETTRQTACSPALAASPGRPETPPGPTEATD